jgi:hypothetical protein
MKVKLAGQRVVFIYMMRSGEYWLDETVKVIADDTHWVPLNAITDKYIKQSEAV